MTMSTRVNSENFITYLQTKARPNLSDVADDFTADAMTLISTGKIPTIKTWPDVQTLLRPDACPEAVKCARRCWLSFLELCRIRSP